MTPAIDAYLAGHAVSLGGGLLLQAVPRLNPRVFCDQVIIEIRPAGPRRWKVGMQISCDELARRGRQARGSLAMEAVRRAAGAGPAAPVAGTTPQH